MNSAGKKLGLGLVRSRNFTLRNFQLKAIAKSLLPPVAVAAFKEVKRISGREIVEWEYAPNGWKSQQTNNNIKGWNTDAVLNTYKAKWPKFVKSLKTTDPIATPLEAASSAEQYPAFQNVVMSYAYALLTAARQKSAIAMLDWGGGMGHYYEIAKALVPDLQIDYHCKDLPVQVEYGRKLHPQAHFYTDESCFKRKYDFVFVSASFQYSENWQATLQKLAQATEGYLFITQLPTVHKVSSFVVVQRAYKYGYNTEYLGWCFNRQEFLQAARANNLELVREFIFDYNPKVYRAPEQLDFRGFLFKV